MITFGVVGYGYWGPNIVRNLGQLEEAEVVAVCDKSPASRRRVQKAHPAVHVTDDSAELMSNSDIDAIAVVTPVWTHYEIAKSALQSGKHVFVEKPFTSNSAQAEELIELAASKNLKIMVDHTFLFTGAVRKIRQVLQDNTLGKLYYYDSTRVNLGLFQHDVNVIWDLAPHDLSIIDHLIAETPEAVVATGQTHLNGHEDVAFITLYFPNSVIAHINVNWLSPVKVRTTLIGGEKKMLVWNDLEADEKVKVYDKGVVQNLDPERREKMLTGYRNGDVLVPNLETTEALRLMAKEFVASIVEQRPSMTDGHAGYRIVRLLEAAQESMDDNGRLVFLNEGAIAAQVAVAMTASGD